MVIAIAAFFLFKEILPKKIFTQKKITRNVIIDSLLLEAVAEAKDSVIVEKDVAKQEKVTFKPTDGIVYPTEKFVEYKGFQYLIPFYEKLFQLENEKKGNVRIAYFGDSMTDGDLIVKDFRAHFQEKFGGKGVGFVNITSESASSRSSLVHQFSNNWKMQSYLKVKKPVNPFGINGHVFYANDTINNPWVSYKANNTKFATILNKPTLFYGSSDNEDGEVYYIINEDTIRKKLTPSNRLNTLRFTEASLPSLKLYFKKADSIPFYGFNFDDGQGVHDQN